MADEKTGKKAGTAASKVLKSKSTGKASKTAAGSALSQRPDKKWAVVKAVVKSVSKASLADRG